MTLDEIAAQLQGIEYRTSPPRDLQKYMKENRIVAVLGASDDLVEFYGAIDDELGAGRIYLNSDGLLYCECDHGENCPYFRKLMKSAKTIDAVWSGDSDYSWHYQTSIPHATFEVFEDGENTHYCQGIVFSLDRLEN
jgi:hypothetical protein